MNDETGATRWIGQSVERLEDPPLVTEAEKVIEDPDVEIVIEVIGGEEPARTLILKAIEQGKHVVTANKEVMAKHGPAILAAAAARGVSVAALLFRLSPSIRT